MQNLSVKRFTVFSASPSIPNDKLIYGTPNDGVIQLDYSNIPSGYIIVGHDCYCDSSDNNENFAYGSIASSNRFRFKRLASNYGFYIYAYAVKIK